MAVVGQLRTKGATGRPASRRKNAEWATKPTAVRHDMLDTVTGVPTSGEVPAASDRKRDGWTAPLAYGAAGYLSCSAGA
jgi:hypothetical protein